MKKINRAKYKKVKNLLKSSIKEDILIGLSVVIKDFSYSDLVECFPNTNGEFKTAYKGEHFWVKASRTFIGVSYCIFAPRKNEETIAKWREFLPQEEIKL